ncbi:MAG: hypothetical protein JWR77_1071 [Rhizorhabdus sp.]|nr:hypothetical protein [Rhizorhabdus sp.]
MEVDVATLARTNAYHTGTRRNSHQEPTLSALEWKVVSLAIREAAEAGCGTMRSSWLGRLVRRATGVQPKMPLADPRLETLRRFVCRVRGRADTSDLSSRLVELGYSPNQISAVAMLAR